MKNTLPRPLSCRLTIVCLLVMTCQAIQAEPPMTRDHPTTTLEQAQPLANVQGMWVWRDSWINTDQAQDELLDFCDKYGFNRLLVQIHDVKEAPVYTIRYPKELTRLVREAGKRGIAVEALDGARDMALAENQAKTLAILDAIIDLNQSMPKGERFVGIHYDIEPYLLDGWKQAGESRRVIMHDLLDYYALARKKLQDRGSDMLLASDIPMWYDRKTDPDDNCILEYHGVTKNLYQHILDVCDYVGIMSYRQHAVGPNSIAEHVADELAYAESIGKTICASMETIEIKDTPQITFYGTSAELFWEQLNLVKKEYGNRPGFAGILVHCYRGTRELLDE